jgi:hypothetical protein
MAANTSAKDPVDLMLRAVRSRALRMALLPLAVPAVAGCSPRAVVPAAMPVEPKGPAPLAPSVGPPQVAVDERVSCAEGEVFPVQAARLKPIVSVDYLALRTSAARPGEGDPNDWSKSDFEELSQHGIPCGSAPPGSSCKATLAKHPTGAANAQCLQMCRELSVVTTRGAEVTRWATPQELSKLLAPIDTVDEALLMADAAHYNVSCEPESTKVRRTVDGYEVFATRLTAMCAPMITTGYWLKVSATGDVSELSSQELARSEACVGRRPAGLVELAGHPGSDGTCGATAASLARSAYLEAASVHAFERLAEELRRWGAPADLIESAQRARADEVRHAEQVGTLARLRGAEVPSAQVEAAQERDLESMAHENAVEGCVRETYGAMVGAFQALVAQQPDVRSSMRSIAEDELEHAALSQRVHQWLMPQLAPEARARVRAAMASTIDELRRGAGAGDPQVARALGLPHEQQATALLAQLERDVWRPLLS